MEREEKAEPINGKEKKKGEENKDEELTEEDRGLKENLDLLVERIVEENAKADVQKAALDTVRCVQQNQKGQRKERKRRGKTTNGAKTRLEDTETVHVDVGLHVGVGHLVHVLTASHARMRVERKSELPRAR